MVFRPMEGVRVVEVAQYTFVPSAGAILAEWGAEVIKVEHAEAGDAQRGLTNLGAVSAAGPFAPIMEHPNHGKRSIGLALEHPEARAVLDEIIRDADVFLTNFLPAARARLALDVDDVRKVNPDIIYGRGSALGTRGPMQRTGWVRLHHLLVPGRQRSRCDAAQHRRHAGHARTRLRRLHRRDDGGRRDIGCSVRPGANGTTVGGRRLVAERWGLGQRPGHRRVVRRTESHGRRRRSAGAMEPRPTRWPGSTRRAEVGGSPSPCCRSVAIGRTSVGTWAERTCCERFETAEKVVEQAEVVSQIIAAELASRPFEEWLERFKTMEGPWEPVQNSLEVGNDEQLRINGYVGDVVDSDGTPRRLIAAPVQFDETPSTFDRAPLFAEHTDDVLRELGHSDDEIMQMKIAGAVT